MRAKPQAHQSNLEAIRRLARRYGVVPTKLRSQNFLLDSTVVQTSIAAAQLQSGTRVFEIGAGFGVLTDALLKTGAELMAFEIDPGLVHALNDRFGRNAHCTIVPQDFFTWFHSHSEELSSPYHIVANLPYHMTSHFFQTVLTAPHPPSSIIVLIQAEVAERIIALPGAMSLLSISVQLYGRPTIVGKVPRSAFWPEPNVDSAILKIEGIQTPPFSVQPIFRIARMAFAGKRKQLHNSLASGLRLTGAEASTILSSAGISPSIRPQELSLDEWQKLAQTVQSVAPEQEKTKKVVR